MEYAEWFKSLTQEQQDALEGWEQLVGPNVEYQDHYLVEDVARGLRLSPVTIRQYIREGKIFARKLGRRWYVPADAVARYIYNELHEDKAAGYVPMGIILIWADTPEISPLIGYKFVSDKELINLTDVSALFQEVDIAENPTMCLELWPVWALDHCLEDIGLISPNLRELERTDSGMFYSNAFEIPPMIKTDLLKLAFDVDWFRAPVALIRQAYKDMFGKEPDTNDLRLLRRVLISYMLEYEDEARLKEAVKWFRFGPLTPEFARIQDSKADDDG